MGWCNVKPGDLQKGDEVRVTVMGGQEFLTVLETRPVENGEVKVRLEWGWHIPSAEPFWDALPANETLTVRR